jgi:hypothetical protein
MADGKTIALSQTERNKRIDELVKAVKGYAEEKNKQLDAEVEFMNSVIKSRTGAGQLTNQGVVDSSNFLVQTISQFLEG